MKPQTQAGVHRPRPQACLLPAALTIVALLLPWSAVHASRAISERRSADAQGDVEIVNVAGNVDVEGWDKNEVEVTGTAGDDVQSVDVTSSGPHTSIRVVVRQAHAWGSSGEARLVVRVPARSSITASLVSADFKISHVEGDLKLQTISGEVKGEVGGEVHATTVSGDIRLEARAAKSIELKTISGEVAFKGGGGDVDVTTVSGGTTLELSELSRGRFKSVSGDQDVQLTLNDGAQVESESVSGNVALKFAAVPGAQFDVQTFSGDIDNCFGPKPSHAQYGPGSRLQFSSGNGRGRVQVSTKSGDVKFCAPGAKHEARASVVTSRVAHVLPAAHRARFAMAMPYVF